MCAPHPIKPLGADNYVPPNPRNAARELRRTRARLNELSRRIADYCEADRAPSEGLIAEYSRAKRDALRAELRLIAVRKAESGKEAV